MTVERASVGAKNEEKEEEEREGLRKRRRSEEGEEEEEEAEEEEDTAVIRSELPPGRRECQQLKEQMTCLANRTNRNGCFLRQLRTDRLKHWIIPKVKEEAEESYPDMDPELALEEILDETLPEIHKVARGLLREQLVSIYYLEKCPLYTSLMNTAERLHRNSHLSVPLAIKEAIRLYKHEWKQNLSRSNIQGKSQNDVTRHSRDGNGQRT